MLTGVLEVTIMSSILLQPNWSVTEIVYVVLVVGCAVGFKIVVLLNPVDGDHKYCRVPDSLT